MDSHRVVIVGGGFAGLRVALELHKRRARLKRGSVTIVDRNAAHLYTPLLYEVASGELASSEACVGELRGGACVNFEEFAHLMRRTGIRVRRGEVEAVDLAARAVRLRDGETLPYDDVVVAVGTEAATYGIPGVAEHAYPLKTLRDAFRVRSRLHRFVKSHPVPAAPFALTVVGGGPTGVEFACEVAHFFRGLAPGAPTCTVSIVEAGDDVLAAFSERVRATARARLDRLGVRVRVRTALRGVKPGFIALAGPDGTAAEEPCDACVWTAGVKPPDALRAWGLPTDERGFVRVGAGFAIEGAKGAYALGDCAAFVHPKTGARVPAMAQVAVREAGVVAENIVRALERKLPTAWHPPERWVTAVPMGGRYAIADFGAFHVADGLGYAVRKVADLQYFLSILPPSEAWKRFRRGANVRVRSEG